MGLLLHFCRVREGFCFPFIERTQGAALGFCSLKVGSFVEVAEASRKNPGLHMPASGPWCPTPTTRGLWP